MNSKDLMIGDWVKTNPGYGKLAYNIKSSTARVSEIGFSNSDGMYLLSALKDDIMIMNSNQFLLQ